MNQNKPLPCIYCIEGIVKVLRIDGKDIEKPCKVCMEEEE
jgi:hypothetical protein